MSSRGGLFGDPVQSLDSDSDRILRFHRSERHLHWAIAIPFMLCYATAVILITVYNPHPARPFRALFSWTHRLSGVSLIILPPLMLLLHWREARRHLQNIRGAWRWTRADAKWLLLVGPATLSSRVSLPDQGKFNAGEKINFMALMSTYPIYALTGALIWLPGTAYMSWVVHVFSAVFVATPLMFGHIFMALVNPDTRVGLSGMITGFVDRHWAKHHYRHWYDETCHETTRLCHSVTEPPRSKGHERSAVPEWAGRPLRSHGSAEPAEAPQPPGHEAAGDHGPRTRDDRLAPVVQSSTPSSGERSIPRVWRPDAVIGCHRGGLPATSGLDDERAVVAAVEEAGSSGTRREELGTVTLEEDEAAVAAIEEVCRAPRRDRQNVA